MEKKIRLSKLMAQKGLCSRREADKLIEQSQVLVDGEIIDTLGTKVSPDAHIELTSQAKKFHEDKVTILLNKPCGYVSTQPEKGYKSAIELITSENQSPTDKTKLKPFHLKKLAAAGRLDINSKGLLVFTQDGTIAKQLIGENSEMEKEYFVRVKQKITPKSIEVLTSKMTLDDKPLKTVKLTKVKDQSFHIILKEGKKRQIRRMCEKADLDVEELWRVRIGKVRLSRLEVGMWRFLRKDETF